MSALFISQVTQPKIQIAAEFIRDRLAEAKLAFFISLATLVEPILREFQSDCRLPPFLYQEITYLITAIMRIVKLEVVEKNSSIMKIKLKDSNFMVASKTDFLFVKVCKFLHI